MHRPPASRDVLIGLPLPSQPLRREEPGTVPELVRSRSALQVRADL